jgi:phosphoribosyl 1,2-cyclic phosphate phosphodiesterase
VPKTIVSTDILGKLILLGTGTSVGVPAIGCGCAVCQSDDPKNNRTRSSAIFGLPGGNLLIDTTPELRIQLIRERLGLVHAVAYTHDHADHIFGLDDLRLFPFAIGGPVPLYCQSQVEERIRKSFDYAFHNGPETHQGSRPRLVFERIKEEPFEIFGAKIIPVPLLHGPKTKVLGFRIGDVAYCTDTNQIPESSMGLLQGLDTLVIGALRYAAHPTHFCIDEVLEVVERLKPRQTYLTHMAHEIDYATAKRELPDGIDPGFDGLSIRLCP